VDVRLPQAVEHLKSVSELVSNVLRDCFDFARSLDELYGPPSTISSIKSVAESILECGLIATINSSSI
jgi:hypothetical protein